MPEPDLTALRALTLVAEEGSLSAAGVRLGVTQQAVSLRIRGLESDLGVRLLTRSPQGSHLTPAGELAVGWAAPMLAAVEEFAGKVRALKTGSGRTLNVAASLTTAEHLLPEWIAAWHRSTRGSGPVIQLTAANSTQVIRLVREGEADLGFIETPYVPGDLGTLVVGHDTVEIVAPASHRWTKNGVVSRHELAKTPLVLREVGSGTRQALEQAMAEAGSPLLAEPAAEIPTALGIRSAVMAGLGPGALSSLVVAEDVRSGRLVRVRIRNLRIERSLTAIWSGSRPPRAAGDFLELIRTTPGPTRAGRR